MDQSIQLMSRGGIAPDDGSINESLSAISSDVKGEYQNTGQFSLNKKMPDFLQPLIDNSDPDLSDSERRNLSDLVTAFKDIFLPPDGKFNQTDLAKHYIDTGEIKPFKLPCRRLPFFKNLLLKRK